MKAYKNIQVTSSCIQLIYFPKIFSIKLMIKTLRKFSNNITQLNILYNLYLSSVFCFYFYRKLNFLCLISFLIIFILTFYSCSFFRLVPQSSFYGNNLSTFSKFEGRVKVRLHVTLANPTYKIILVCRTLLFMRKYISDCISVRNSCSEFCLNCLNNIHGQT